MQTLQVSPLNLLAPAEAPQAPNGVLDTQKLNGVFLLDFFYEGKAANQQIDITIEVKPDRFSPLFHGAPDLRPRQPERNRSL
ncbi:hypothetical protein [Pseudomonas sp. B21-021]|uniref:hypothetical protein n=1 Tax=Pseudomonas sp. B21-021 TaxID=2895476 RepID=UPI0021608178|nr:hypothetical protein [Pseudomonas sp. B21-021]UVM28291.1 hypothetical protein LOY31_04265 [Pseudomonas sp. B21-021]